MNECERYREMLIESELEGGAAARPHCAECAADREGIVRILDGGRALAAATLDDDVVESGRRRLLARIEKLGGRGLAALLAMIGGLFLAGMAALSGGHREMVPRAALAAGAGAVGAAGAIVARQTPLARRVAARPHPVIMRMCAN